MINTRMFVCSLMAASTLAISLDTTLDLATVSPLPEQALVETEAIVDGFRKKKKVAGVHLQEATAPTDVEVGDMARSGPKKNLPPVVEAFLNDPEHGSVKSKPNQEGVNDKCCVFYRGEHFDGSEDYHELCHEGKRVTWEIDTTRTTFKTAQEEKYRSFRCGAHTWLDMCNGKDCNAENAQNYMSTAGRVDNAKFKSVEGRITVGAYDPKHVPAVVIFGGEGCTGASARLYSSADPAERTVEYGKNRVEIVPKYKGYAGTYAPHFAESAMVPHGYTLSVFQEDNFKTPLQDIVGGFEEDGDGRAICVDFPDGKAWSMRVTRAKEGRLTAYWKAITASETLTYTVAVGITSTDSSVEKESSVHKLENSLKTGISLGSTVGGKVPTVPGLADGLGVSVNGGYTRDTTETESMTDTLAREITSTSGSSLSTTHSTTCTSAKGEGGAGLWQWVLETEDHGTAAFTSHTVCRFDKLARTPPTCHWFECENEDCGRCKGEYFRQENADGSVEF